MKNTQAGEMGQTFNQAKLPSWKFKKSLDTFYQKSLETIF